jgi:peptide/nickel transport system permease protein
MKRFIFKRLLFSLPLLLGITFLTFLFIHLAPGNFFDNLRLNPQISRQTIKLYEEKFNLDKPFFVQYLTWLKNVLSGNLGDSFAYKAPVSKIISSRAANTLILSVSSIIFTWILVIPLGIISAVKRDKFIDKLLSFFSYLAISTPTFLLAFLFLFYATFTHWLPLGGMRSVNYQDLNFWGRFFDVVRHLIIPTVVLSLGSIFGLQRILRANLLEVLGSSYILGAKARGITPTRIIYVHALKNALNPMITIFGYQFSSILSGAALTEIIVGWPGLGQVTLAAVMMQDLYLVMGSVLMGSVFLIIGNLLADICLAYADPRIRYEER